MEIFLINPCQIPIEIKFLFQVAFTSTPTDPSADATEVTAKCPTNAFSLDTLMPAPQTTVTPTSTIPTTMSGTHSQCQSTEVAQPGLECKAGEVCVNQDCCPSFLALANSRYSLQKGSTEYNATVNELKSKVCNKAGRGVCC